MDYLSSVINETLRMYMVTAAKRECNKDYEWNGMIIPENIEVNILLDAMSNDERYFPEPEKFLPERERPLERFLPFGNGPRACVAMRFAVFEIKLALTKILSKYRFEKCSKTVVSSFFTLIGDKLLFILLFLFVLRKK